LAPWKTFAGRDFCFLPGSKDDGLQTARTSGEVDHLHSMFDHEHRKTPIIAAELGVSAP
jgi:hypothetical protein